MRPKSIATVVVFLPATAVVSSTSTEAIVIIASVVSGRISETEPTIVVLPTPKPPATTILAEVARGLVMSMLIPPSQRQRRVQFGAQRRGQHLADALDEKRHLVPHLADVAGP